MPKTSRVDKELYLQYYNNGVTDMEIAKALSIPYRTVSNFRANILKLPIVEDTIIVTKLQDQILMGTLLGDTSILYVHKQSKNPHITFSHTIAQEIYFKTKYNNLSTLMSSFLQRKYEGTRVIRDKEVKSSETLYAIGKCLKCLVEYKTMFHPIKEKIIPLSVITERFTDISLAYLFMDDGCRNGDTINLNMQSYNTEDLYSFIGIIKDKFDVVFNLKKDKTLYLTYPSRDKFKNIVLPYITEDTKYKIQHLCHL